MDSPNRAWSSWQGERVGLLFGVILLGAAALACGRHGVEAGSDSTSESTVMFVVFDPTILAADDIAGLSETLDEMRRLFLAVPENARVVVRLVRPGTLQSPPLFERYFQFETSFAGEETHASGVREAFDGELRPLLQAAWTDAHKPQAVTRLSSCLLTALFVVGREQSTYSCLSPQVHCHLLLISDMLEACQEWGEPINLERGPAELSRLENLEMEKVDLSHLCSATVVQVPSPRVTMPGEVASIERFWGQRLVEFGLEESRLLYSLRFPPGFELACVEHD